MMHILLIFFCYVSSLSYAKITKCDYSKTEGYWGCASKEYMAKENIIHKTCEDKDSVQETIDCYKNLISKSRDRKCEVIYSKIKNDCQIHYLSEKDKHKLKSIKQAQDIIRININKNTQDHNQENIDQVYDLKRGETLFYDFSRYVKVHVMRFFPIIQKKINTLNKMLKYNKDKEQILKEFENIKKLIRSLESKYIINQKWYIDQIEKLYYPLHKMSLKVSLKSWDHALTTIKNLKKALDNSYEGYQQYSLKRLQKKSIIEFYRNEMLRLTRRVNQKKSTLLEEKQLQSITKLCEIRFKNNLEICNVGQTQ